ncbi:MAG TPA: hypothetical protein VFK05_30110 [Polyangiaceae bacterium]|nr:hypothetical protein [Polyangiaceae bacterium]
MLHRTLTVSTLLTVASLAGCGSTDSQASNGGAGAGAGETSSAGSPASGGGSDSSEGGSSTVAGGSPAAGAGSSEGGSTGAAGASSAGAAGLPPIEPSTKLSALTPDQQALYCDWAAAQLGGYGKVNQCAGSGSVTVYKDRADCESQAFLITCGDKLTIGQLEECTQAQGPTGGCTFPEEHCHWLHCR